MFTLEALQADHGDALLLRYGDGDGRLILIDAGPSGVYKRVVRPRLEQLRGGGPDDRLFIERIMVSHTDGDHIEGIVDLFDELQVAAESRLAQPYRIGGLWLNAFSADVLGAAADTAALSAAVASVAGAEVGDVGPESAAVVASIPEARSLSGAAKVLDIRENADFDSGVAMATPTGPVAIPFDGGLTFTVIGPNAARIDDLKERWQAFLKARKDGKPAEAASAAVSVDRSVYNLSSIVALAERKDRTMLLTGDALGGDILEFLDGAGRLTNGAIHVDLLKMPHHGSVRNVARPNDLMKRITADHYVFSANGKFGNPDPDTIKLLVEARGAEEYTMWFTNVDARIDQVLGADRAAHKRHYQVEVRAAADLFVPIDLEGTN